MKPRRWSHLVAMNLRRDRRAFLLSSAGVAVGVAAFVYFVGLGAGISRIVRQEIFPVEATHLEVVPSKVALGSLLGGGKLDEAALGRLEVLPGVARLYRKMELLPPAVSRYDGDFFGHRLRMGLEIIGQGVERDYLAGDLPAGQAFQPDAEGVVPVVISRRLLEVYNHGFATSRGLPKLDPAMVTGLRFPLTLGRSYVASGARRGPSTDLTLELVGVSDRALLGGVTLPLETVRELNRRWGGEEAAGEYQAVVLELDQVERAAQIKAKVERMGLAIKDDQHRLAEQVGGAIWLTTGALSFLSFLILGLAAVAIARAAFAGVVARTREIGVMRAVGARRRDVASVVLGEAAAAGLLGGIMGVALGLGAALGTDVAALSWMPDFPFKPESFFTWPLWLLPGALLAALLFALGGAAPAALRAARLDPTRALGGG
ncbi:MAG: ABC transporter permease [Deltaproteobacteria bacterium]|nr:ABC transporter permease [Deltaproteobacteria bacterium]